MERGQSGRRRPTGRRAGDSGTRDAILDAARDLFAEKGYDKASVRAIAAQAGVDPALIRHFFSNKERLFAATLTDRTVIAETMYRALQGDPATVGRRAADAFLGLWEDPEVGPTLLSLVRSAVTSEQVGAVLSEQLLLRLRPAQQDGARPAAGSSAHEASQRQARGLLLAATQMMGIALGRHVLRAPLLAELSHDELVDLVAPTVQRHLEGSSQPE